MILLVCFGLVFRLCLIDVFGFWCLVCILLEGLVPLSA